MVPKHKHLFHQDALQALQKFKSDIFFRLQAIYGLFLARHLAYDL
jgi:hypothetical protein